MKLLKNLLGSIFSNKKISMFAAISIVVGVGFQNCAKVQFQGADSLLSASKSCALTQADLLPYIQKEVVTNGQAKAWSSPKVGDQVHFWLASGLGDAGASWQLMKMDGQNNPISQGGLVRASGGTFPGAGGLTIGSYIMRVTVSSDCEESHSKSSAASVVIDIPFTVGDSAVNCSRSSGYLVVGNDPKAVQENVHLGVQLPGGCANPDHTTRWDFGDDSVMSAILRSDEIDHAYSAAGLYSAMAKLNFSNDGSHKEVYKQVVITSGQRINCPTADDLFVSGARLTTAGALNTYRLENVPAGSCDLGIKNVTFNFGEGTPVQTTGFSAMKAWVPNTLPTVFNVLVTVNYGANQQKVLSFPVTVVGQIVDCPISGALLSGATSAVVGSNLTHRVVLPSCLVGPNFDLSSDVVWEISTLPNQVRTDSFIGISFQKTYSQAGLNQIKVHVKNTNVGQFDLLLNLNIFENTLSTTTTTTLAPVTTTTLAAPPTTTTVKVTTTTLPATTTSTLPGVTCSPSTMQNPSEACGAGYNGGTKFTSRVTTCPNGPSGQPTVTTSSYETGGCIPCPNTAVNSFTPYCGQNSVPVPNSGSRTTTYSCTTGTAVPTTVETNSGTCNPAPVTCAASTVRNTAVACGDGFGGGTQFTSTITSCPNGPYGYPSVIVTPPDTSGCLPCPKATQSPYTPTCQSNETPVANSGTLTTYYTCPNGHVIGNTVLSNPGVCQRNNVTCVESTVANPAEACGPGYNGGTKFTSTVTTCPNGAYGSPSTSVTGYNLASCISCPTSYGTSFTPTCGANQTAISGSGLRTTIYNCSSGSATTSTQVTNPGVCIDNPITCTPNTVNNASVSCGAGYNGGTMFNSSITICPTGPYGQPSTTTSAYNTYACIACPGPTTSNFTPTCGPGQVGVASSGVNTTSYSCSTGAAVGSTSVTNAGSCQACTDNTIAQNNQCVACPSGQVASADHTSCSTPEYSNKYCQGGGTVTWTVNGNTCSAVLPDYYPPKTNGTFGTNMKCDTSGRVEQITITAANGGQAKVNCYSEYWVYCSNRLITANWEPESVTGLSCPSPVQTRSCGSPPVGQTIIDDFRWFGQGSCQAGSCEHEYRYTGSTERCCEPCQNPTTTTTLPTAAPTDFGACFVKGTKVSMKDGSTKAIEDVQVGDEVRTYDELHQKYTVSPVEEVFHHQEKLSILYTFNFEDEKVTSNDIHPFFIPAEQKYFAAEQIFVRWLKGENLNLLTENSGRSKKILSIERDVKRVPLYNLHVTSPYDQVSQWGLPISSQVGHNYFANGVLVHNVKMGGCLSSCNVYCDAAFSCAEQTGSNFIGGNTSVVRFSSQPQKDSFLSCYSNIGPDTSQCSNNNF